VGVGEPEKVLLNRLLRIDDFPTFESPIKIILYDNKLLLLLVTRGENAIYLLNKFLFYNLKL
jgi:hypothetical protein